LLVGIVGALALGANLPEDISAVLSIDRRLLLAGLLAVVGVSLVRYLKFTLILVIALLAVGANLPEGIAKEFGIDTQIALLALVVMIVVSLSNKVLKLQSGLDKSSRPASAHGAAALFNAILKGRTAVVQTLMQQGVNVNIRTVSGKTPLMAAAYKGYSDIAQLLVDHGADVNVRDGKGDTALKIATRNGYTRIVDLLKKAGAKSEEAGAAPAAAA
jgi:hypothetical protein